MRWQSVRLSARLSHRSQQQRRAAGLLLSALPVGYVDRQLRDLCCKRRRSAATAPQHGAQQQMRAADVGG